MDDFIKCDFFIIQASFLLPIRSHLIINFIENCLRGTPTRSMEQNSKSQERNFKQFPKCDAIGRGSASRSELREADLSARLSDGLATYEGGQFDDSDDVADIKPLDPKKKWRRRQGGRLEPDGPRPHSTSSS